MDQNNLKYSVVIPIYNEEGAVANLHRDIKNVLDTLQQPYEIIFVDDGSQDRSLARMKDLNPLKIISFRKNFGQTAALDAGIKQAQGEVIITLDGDGQNPPSEIPKLLKKLDRSDYDVISGWRYQRKDSFGKKFASRGANFLRGFLVKDEIQDSGCSLKVYKRECFEDIDLYGEMHRFIPAILKWQGFKIGEVKVEHKERTTGKTKYNWKRTIKGFLDMWSVWFWRKYSARPLHLFGTLGLIMGAIGSILGICLTILRIFGLISLQSSIWPLVAVFLIIVGLQLFVSGILADIAVKTYYKGRNSNYTIKEIINNS